MWLWAFDFGIRYSETWQHRSCVHLSNHGLYGSATTSSLKDPKGYIISVILVYAIWHEKQRAIKHWEVNVKKSSNLWHHSSSWSSAELKQFITIICKCMKEDLHVIKGYCLFVAQRSSCSESTSPATFSIWTYTIFWYKCFRSSTEHLVYLTVTVKLTWHVKFHWFNTKPIKTSATFSIGAEPVVVVSSAFTARGCPCINSFMPTSKLPTTGATNWSHS